MERRAKSWESEMNEELRQFQGELAGVLSLAGEVAAERKASQQSTEVPVEELLQLRKELGKMKGFLLEVCEMLQESQEREAQLKETQATTLKQARAKLRDSESELQEKQAKLMQREADFERAMQDKEREFQQTARQQQVREKELRQREVAVAEREKDKERDFQETARQQQVREHELRERERVVLQREKELKKRPLAPATSPGSTKVAQTPEDIAQVPQRARAKQRQPQGPSDPAASREVPAQVKRKKRVLSDYKSQDEQRWGWYQHSAERKRESLAATEPLSQPQTPGEEQEPAEVLEDSRAPWHSRLGQEAPGKGCMTLDLGELLDAVSKGLDPLEVEQTKRQKQQSQDFASAEAEGGDEDLSEPEAPEEINWSCDEAEVEEVPQAVPKPQPTPPVPREEDALQPPAEDIAPQEPARLNQSGPARPLLIERGSIATSAVEEDLNKMSEDPHDLHLQPETDAADQADVHASQEPLAPTDGALDMEEASPAALEPPEPVLTGRQKKQKWMEKKFPGLPVKGASKGGRKGQKPPRAEAKAPVLHRPWPKLGSSRPSVVRRLLPKEEWAYRPLPTRRVVEGYSKVLLKEFAQLNQLPDVNSLLPPL